MMPSQAAAVGRRRWWICALLFAATTINYIDRNALSVLKTRLQQPLEAGGLALTDADYGWITFAFTAAYAAFPPLIGTAIDRFGVKRSLGVALVLWSLASAAHGLAALTGLALVGLITWNWQACVAAASFSGAAQALTAAIGLGLIGALLTYAGRAHGRPASLIALTS